MKFGFLLSVGVFALLTGCTPSADSMQTSGSMNIPSKSDRFDVTRVQKFTDELAYEDERGIYIITDRKTGREFLGVSGIGISELGSHSSGKTTQSDER